MLELLRSITLNTEDGNFSVSMLLYKDEAFEDMWTTVPSLTLDQNIFAKVFMVSLQIKIVENPTIKVFLYAPYKHISLVGDGVRG